MARNHRLRFANNNFSEEPNITPVFSSELVNFPFSNSQNPVRSKVWKPTGSFTITTDNNFMAFHVVGAPGIGIYGVVLDSGIYETGADLAAAIETKALIERPGSMNVTYSTSTYEFIFTAISTDIALLITHPETNLWDTIGFLTGSGDIGPTSVITSDEPRVHSSEHVTYDLGFPAPVSFFAMISSADQSLGLTQYATVTLSGNNVNDFSGSQPYTIQATITSDGVFAHLDTTNDDDDLPSFRYWHVDIQDRTNPAGGQFLNIGNLYIGDSVTIQARNISRGFSKSLVDPTTVVTSDSGALFFDKKTKYSSISNIALLYMTQADRVNIENVINTNGISVPYYLIMDPAERVSADIGELIVFGYFSKMPNVTHVSSDVYSISFDFRESV